MSVRIFKSKTFLIINQIQFFCVVLHTSVLERALQHEMFMKEYMAYCEGIGCLAKSQKTSNNGYCSSDK